MGRSSPLAQQGRWVRGSFAPEPARWTAEPVSRTGHRGRVLAPTRLDYHKVCTPCRSPSSRCSQVAPGAPAWRHSAGRGVSSPLLQQKRIRRRLYTRYVIQFGGFGRGCLKLAAGEWNGRTHRAMLAAPGVTRAPTSSARTRNSTTLEARSYGMSHALPWLPCML